VQSVLRLMEAVSRAAPGISNPEMLRHLDSDRFRLRISWDFTHGFAPRSPPDKEEAKPAGPNAGVARAVKPFTLSSWASWQSTSAIAAMAMTPLRSFKHH